MLVDLVRDLTRLAGLAGRGGSRGLRPFRRGRPAPGALQPAGQWHLRKVSPTLTVIMSNLFAILGTFPEMSVGIAPNEHLQGDMSVAGE